MLRIFCIAISQGDRSRLSIISVGECFTSEHTRAVIMIKPYMDMKYIFI